MVECSGASGDAGGREKSQSACPTPARWRLRVSPVLSEGCRVFPPPNRVPGETLGSSVVIVAFLPEGVVLVPALRSTRSLVGGVRWAQRFWSLFLFVNPPVVGICFFCIFSFSSFGRVFVLLPPQRLSSVVSGCCFIYKAGRKPISRDDTACEARF